ncbi:MAG: hypothetical protein WBB84_05020, partial [Candidatus Omnitrophota bacterium]
MRLCLSGKSIVLKTISLFLVLTFSVYNVSFAAKEDAENVPVVEEIQKEITVDDIGIAIDAGMVKSKYKGETDKIIVHIQDAHCNYEAQSNINRILDQLTKEAGVNMISVEGAEGIVDTSWFKAFPDPEIRKEVADYFMKKGEITGAEFFSINSDYEGTIFGAEEREYYVENLKAFTEVYPYKEVIENYFLNLRTLANRLKSYVYTPKLKELVQKINAFDDKELELSDYAEYLNKNAKKYKVDLSKDVNFKKLIDTLDYEKKIDFDIVDQERNSYIDAVSKKLSKEKMAELVGESIRFKKGHIKAVDFYSHLRELADECDVPIVREYPNLFYYYLYTKLYDQIDNEGLFKELESIKTRLKDKLFENDVQRKLDKCATAIDLHIDLVNIELTNDDYDLFKGYFDEFSLEDVVNFFGGLCGKYGLTYSDGTVPVQVSENLPSMVAFYEVAMKRDKVLIENTLRQMEKEKQKTCVLISGGFHTRGFKNILEKKGISYLVVTPKITKDVETPYIKVLTNQRTSLEDIITESAAMPGMKPRAREEAAARPRGEMLAPLLVVAYDINLFLEDKADLQRFSDRIGAIQGRTLMDKTRETLEDIIRMLVASWLARVKIKLQERFGPRGMEQWYAFMVEPEKSALLVRAYVHNLYKAGISLRLAPPVMYGIIGIVGRAFKTFREEEVAKFPATAEVREAEELVPAPGVVPEGKAETLPEAVKSRLEGKGPVILLPASEMPVGLERPEGPYYWFGARGRSETSAIQAEDAEVTLNDVLRYPFSDTVTSFLGEGVVPATGRRFPAFNVHEGIESPREMIDTRDKLWVVTAVSTPAVETPGEAPRIILGFNPDLVREYRERYEKAPEGYEFHLIGTYKASIVGYREALASLERFLQGTKEYADTLSSVGDVVKAAEALKEHEPVAARLAELRKARAEVERFYNYHEAKVGEHIFIPAGTIYALPAGVQVFEPEVAGRREFAVENPEFLNDEIEVEVRIDDVTEDVTKEPRLVVKPEGTYVEEGFPGIFAAQGFEARTITLERPGSQTELPTGGSFHVLAVMGEGEAEVMIGEERIKVPNIFESRRAVIVPAAAEKFTLVSMPTPKGGEVQVIDMSAPLPKETFPVTVREGETIYGTDVPESLEEFVLVTHQTGDIDTYDVLHIMGDAAYRPSIEEVREHVLTVMEGRIRVHIEGEEKPIDLGTGAVLPVA